MEYEDLQNIKVGRKEIAKVCGYAEKYINELVRDHNFPKDEGHNQYPLILFLQRLREYEKENYEKELEKIKSDKPQDDLARKNAHLKQLEIDQLEGRLLPTQLFEQAYLDDRASLKISLSGLGIKCATRLQGETNVTTISDLINEELDKILEAHATAPLPKI